MQWNKKYNYPSSTRSIINHSRMYSLNNQIFPSVTSILQMTKSESEKASLKAWSERVGFKESLRIKNEAAQRGTQMHSLIENFLLQKDNLELFEKEKEENHAQRMADLIISEGLKNKLNEINGVECTVYYSGPKGFAGTADLIGVYENIPSIIDFKQKNSIMKESYESLQTYLIQLGGYSLAHNTAYGSSITQGVILLATTDLVFQVFRINDEKLIEYQNKFLDRVDQYYSLINN
jgi:genome maintenance exonuclease 1|tara:strand:+ start:810 stop:1514 length:705 start_codon:yes stop_codon:yes gene_type:complete